MTDLTIKLPIPEGKETFFAERDLMITPVNEQEAQQLAAALEALELVTKQNRKALATLDQLVETKGATVADIAKTLAMLREPNAIGLEQVQYVRTLLGRPARVGRLPPASKGKLQ